MSKWLNQQYNSNYPKFWSNPNRYSFMFYESNDKYEDATYIGEYDD